MAESETITALEQLNLPPQAVQRLNELYKDAPGLKRKIEEVPEQVPRDMLYIAWKLGIITTEQLAIFPPQIRTEPLRQKQHHLLKRKRYSKRRLTKSK